ncbi:superoxide dismutase, Cu-Zn family [Salinicoccus halodurans]|uniref:Superoxide dismutase [Cu-Zn] n=1 Tax=Salinicoccus halodurans TaxID=407035 RepID=A0AA94KWY4_9STAP|nr:superoxide dismutase, Cu-Zn family [Salinicoccus halodurans]
MLINEKDPFFRKRMVFVNFSLSDMAPGDHGFHIHETGSCEQPDFESAGGHYNPTDANHGMDDPEGPHAGDMKNIEVSEDGTVNTEVTADMVTLEEGQDNTLFTEDGTALVIHSGADDYEMQPSGDAGDRIACGVIGGWIEASLEDRSLSGLLCIHIKKSS